MKLDINKTDWNQNSHAMIDLETFGTEEDSVLLSISVVQFNAFTGETFNTFEVFLDVEDQLKLGSQVNSSTIFWWMKQDETVRNQIINGCENGMKLKPALEALTSFVKVNNLKFQHGKGPSFDNSKIAKAYSKVGLQNPFKYYNDRCVRTIIALNRDLAKSVIFEGNLHNGIDDAKHQIKQVSTNLQELYEIKEDVKFPILSAEAKEIVVIEEEVIVDEATTEAKDSFSNSINEDVTKESSKIVVGD